jgi:hypothetical protein
VDKWLKQEAPESFDPARMTFEDLAKVFEKKKLVKAKYVNGRKVAGRRELSAPKAWLASLLEYFGKKKLAGSDRERRFPGTNRSYSRLRAIAGSTLLAAKAGKTHANRAPTTSTSAAPISVSGSDPLTP